eukprot:g30896.t1
MDLITAEDVWSTYGTLSSSSSPSKVTSITDPHKPSQDWISPNTLPVEVVEDAYLFMAGDTGAPDNYMSPHKTWMDVGSEMDTPPRSAERRTGLARAKELLDEYLGDQTSKLQERALAQELMAQKSQNLLANKVLPDWEKVNPLDQDYQAACTNHHGFVSSLIIEDERPGYVPPDLGGTSDQEESMSVTDQQTALPARQGDYSSVSSEENGRKLAAGSVSIVSEQNGEDHDRTPSSASQAPAAAPDPPEQPDQTEILLTLQEKEQAEEPVQKLQPFASNLVVEVEGGVLDYVPPLPQSEAQRKADIEREKARWAQVSSLPPSSRGPLSAQGSDTSNLQQPSQTTLPLPLPSAPRPSRNSTQHRSRRSSAPADLPSSRLAWAIGLPVSPSAHSEYTALPDYEDGGELSNSKFSRRSAALPVEPDYDWRNSTIVRASHADLPNSHSNTSSPPVGDWNNSQAKHSDLQNTQLSQTNDACLRNSNSQFSRASVLPVSTAHIEYTELPNSPPSSPCYASLPPAPAPSSPPLSLPAGPRPALPTSPRPSLGRNRRQTNPAELPVFEIQAVSTRDALETASEYPYCNYFLSREEENASVQVSQDLELPRASVPPQLTCTYRL